MKWELYMWHPNCEIVLIGTFDTEEQCRSTRNIAMSNTDHTNLFFTWFPVQQEII